MKRKNTAKALVSLALVSAFALTACAPGGGGGGGGGETTAPVSQADIDAAMDTETTITFWTWVPDIQKEVDLFEAKYPKITVDVVNVGTGTVQYPKLRTALKAGKGAPDVAQIEYQYIPSFRQTDSLVDLTPYGGAELESKYVEWVWNQVADDSGVWSVPQDSGPLGNLYRSDIYEQAGITAPPATWDEFAEQAQTVKDETGSYMSNLPGNDPGQVVGLFWQAGAKPFSYDGDKTVGIDLDSAETQKVVTFWQDLIDKDLVSTDADFTDSWYQGFSSGKYASWQTAAWGPVFLQGTAANTSGKWTAAKIPQWEAGDDVSGNWGGSSDAVITGTKNPIVAAEFSKFLNSDPESTLAFANEQFLFPTTTDTLSSSEFTGTASDFYGGQKVNELFAGVSDTVSTDFQWLPFMDYVYSSFNDTLGKAIADHDDMSAALTAWQDDVTAYAKQQGFTVQ
ncbi:MULTISPECIES: ABC transporter substrate-binding protein [Frigoribacterium]|uniref:ABC transporter substrate-binding protein n=1 Tax=Frigoribacterium TaxID=96492 RepID=UPI00177C0D73|nr:MULTISPECIES: extracellular solute-binding protein [Frigoribacterium]MBD8704401.1 extracellular solute-binding protein [Frigoribacterium sp. CFBP 13712]MCJ0701269.1 extracellular solute-binding protein [Frigoribacterium faeni]